jgi:hypothetical protein
LPYGARLDVKLVEAADEPQTVTIEFVAECPLRQPGDHSI